jgi:hypothetical protein
MRVLFPTVTLKGLRAVGFLEANTSSMVTGSLKQKEISTRDKCE